MNTGGKSVRTFKRMIVYLVDQRINSLDEWSFLTQEDSWDFVETVSKSSPCQVETPYQC